MLLEEHAQSDLRMTPQETDLHTASVNGRPVFLDLWILFAVTVAVYARCLVNGFVDFEDPLNVLQNSLVTHPTLHSLWTIWADMSARPYAPPVYSVYAAIYAVFGAHPLAFHAVSVLLHATNALLVYLIVTGLLRQRIPALTAALLFALHPIHVDAVAWVSGLKDVLSGTFALLSMLAYVRYLKSRKRSTLTVSLIMYVLALLSKPIAALLPYLLLIVDYQQRRKDGSEELPEKTFFFVAAVLLGLVTWQTRGGHALELMTESVSYYSRTNAWAAIGFYVYKLLIPLKLSVLYASTHTPGWYVGTIGLSIAFVSVTCWMLMLSRDYGFGLAWFVLLATPILGFLPFGYVVSVAPFANHYMYLADVGLFVCCGLIVRDIYKRLFSTQHKAVLFAAMFIVLSLFALKTTLRCGTWHNSQTLWTDAVKYNRSPNASLGHYRLARVLAEDRDLDNALIQAQEALKLNPQYKDARSLFETLQTQDILLHHRATPR